MKLRPLLITGLLLILLQYLVFSEYANSFLLPELGVLLLCLSRSWLNRTELVAAALVFGYTADVLGAVETASVLIGYCAVAGVLILLSRVFEEKSLTNATITYVTALVAFHAVGALIASPILWRQWLGVVAVQLASMLIFLSANEWLQRRWRPAA